MIKRLLIFCAGALLALSAAGELKGTTAIVERTDGRAWRVALQGVEGDQLIVRLENSSANRSFKLSDIARLEFTSGSYDISDVQSRFNTADYGAVIRTLGPVAALYMNYAFLPNNREADLGLLMKTLYRNGNFEQAAALSVQLAANPNMALQNSAKAYQALALLGAGDRTAAEEIRQKLTDPSAQLYLQACIERAESRPVDAIQTAVKLIAEHGNDMNWMPQTELLCAELYRELGMTNSAAAVARQTCKLYEGTNIGAEAQKLQTELGQITE